MRVTIGQATNPLRRHLRRHLVGYLAILGFAVASGVEAADGPLAGQDTVGSDDIIDGEVRSVDIGNGLIFNNDVAQNAIQSSKVANATLTGADFGPDSLTGDDVAEATFYGDNSLTTADVNESALFNDDSLATNDFFFFAAGTDEIVANAVSADEVDDDSLQADELAADSVGSSEIASEEVSTSELAPVVVERAATTILAGEADTVFIGCPAGDAPLNVGYAGEPGVRVLGTDPIVSDGEVSAFAITFDNRDADDPASVEVTAMCLEG